MKLQKIEKNLTEIKIGKISFYYSYKTLIGIELKDTLYLNKSQLEYTQTTKFHIKLLISDNEIINNNHTLNDLINTSFDYSTMLRLDIITTKIKTEEC